MDIPGALMQTDVNDTVYVRLSGPLETLLTKVDKKKYEKFVVEEGGKPVIYVRLKKAIYGTLNASLISGRISRPSSKDGALPSTHTMSVWITR